ncbi:MAG: hypothetical protein N2Z70_00815 [Bdellovibrionaceae bacterium]|jgi:hypothetical protein|nr:hypothetical protein [Pseudobdellovibrionaceae bacterium]
MRILSLLIICLFTKATEAQLKTPDQEVLAVDLRLAQGVPAGDLVDPKTSSILSPEFILELERQNQSSSHFNPLPNRLWNPSASPSVNGISEHVVQFIKHGEDDLPLFYFAQVRGVDNPLKSYRLTLTRRAFNATLRHQLLRKMGYQLPTLRYYTKLVVQFRNLEQLQEFEDRAQQQLLADFESRQWIAAKDTKSLTLTLRHVVLEESPSDFYDFHWGLGPNPLDSSQRAFLNRLGRLRAWRALLVPFVLTEIPESWNRFRSQAVSVLAGQALFYHPSSQSFVHTTRADLEWALRQIENSLPSITDWQKLVNTLGLPPSLEQLLVAKLLHRYHQLRSVFLTHESSRLPKPTLEFNSADGLVKNGLLTFETLPQYPIRFTHGDRESPVSQEDLVTYFQIRGWNSALQSALNHFNEKLQFLSIQNVVDQRLQTIRSRIEEHIRTKPNEPLYQEVEAWGGVVSGINVTGSRSLIAGNYQNSLATIQLIDNLGASVSLGYFAAIAGIENTTPTGLAQVRLARDYTYIKPLLSVAESKKIPWKNLWLPNTLSPIKKAFDNPSTEASWNELKETLRENETLIVTDSITLGAQASASARIDILAGLSFMNFANRISLGWFGQKAVLRQTLITRTKNGFIVNTSTQLPSLRGINWDAQWFLKFWEAAYIKQQTQIQQQTYVLEEDRLADNKLMALQALKAAYLQNQTRPLREHFSHLQLKIHHQLDTQIWMQQLLAYKIRNFKETHQLSLKLPQPEGRSELDPKHEEIKVFSYREGQLLGRDLLGFITQVLQSWIDYRAPRSRINVVQSDYTNPAQVPLGRAEWRLLRTEYLDGPEFIKKDLSITPLQKPMVNILEHNWGGWQMSRKDFLNLMNRITERFQSRKHQIIPFFESDQWNATQSIHFYRVTAFFSLLPSGTERLIRFYDSVEPQWTHPPRYKGLSRLFQKLSQVSSHQYDPREPSFIQRLALAWGEGDLELGYSIMRSQCESENLNKEGHVATGVWRSQVFYECLESRAQKALDHLQKLKTAQKDPIAYTRWSGEALLTLHDMLPWPLFLDLFQSEDYLFFIRVNGFRKGDEDGDLEWISSSFGSPKQGAGAATGYLQWLAQELGIPAFLLEKSQGGF